MKKSKRIIGIDLVKVLAVILVLSVHFFYNTKFYQTETFGINMKIQMIVRNFCFMCVPLFLVTTGFLNKEKEYNKSFFKKLINILIIWAFYSTIEFLVLHLIHKDYNGLNIGAFINSLLSFKACGYSWYIEMFIGLFLLSPIINNAFENFDQKNRRNLLIISIILFALPSFINTVFKNSLHLPNWWIGFYPIAYYILGKWIYYEKPVLNKRVLIVLMFFAQLLMFFYNVSYKINDYHLFIVYIPTALTFLFCYNIDIKNGFITKIIVYLSTITLDIYLASSLIDKLIYPWIYNHFAFTQQRIILFMPLTVLITFTLSTLYSSFRKLIIKVR